LVTRREVRKERAMQKIVTNLWFDTEAEEAANFYISAFSDRPGFPSEGKSEIVNISHDGEAGPREAGMVLTVASCWRASGSPRSTADRSFRSPKPSRSL
jgi:predicted 3-demethylubiquinone-9 3-methyltransferase (glyoxalase superfamily)